MKVSIIRFIFFNSLFASLIIFGPTNSNASYYCDANCQKMRAAAAVITAKKKAAPAINSAIASARNKQTQDLGYAQLGYNDSVKAAQDSFDKTLSDFNQKKAVYTQEVIRSIYDPESKKALENYNFIKTACGPTNKQCLDSAQKNYSSRLTAARKSAEIAATKQVNDEYKHLELSAKQNKYSYLKSITENYLSQIKVINEKFNKDANAATAAYPDVGAPAIAAGNAPYIWARQAANAQLAVNIQMLKDVKTQGDQMQADQLHQDQQNAQSQYQSFMNSIERHPASVRRGAR